MKKIKEFINKYKAELLIALSAMSGIIATLITKEGIDAAVGSVLIAVLAIVAEVIKNGVTEKSLELLANAVKILLEELGNIEVIEDQNTKVASTRVVKNTLTIEDIKKRLVE